MALSTAVFVGDAQEWISDLVALTNKLRVGPGKGNRAILAYYIFYVKKNVYGYHPTIIDF